MSEGSHLNGSLDRKASAVQLDPLDLMERLGRHVVFTAVRTDNDRNLLDEQEAFPFAIGSGDLSNPRPFLTTVIACHLFTFA